MNMSNAEKDNRADEVLRFIVRYVRENGFAPSYREICANTVLRSTSTVRTYIYKLEEQGYILFKGGPRKIAVLDDGFERVDSLERDN